MRYFSEEPIGTENPITGTDLELYWTDLGTCEIPEEWTSKYPGPKTDKKSFTVFYMSEKPAPVGLWIAIHGHLAEKKLDLLQINVNRKYNSEPPPRILNTSAELGGIDGVKNFWPFVDGLHGMCSLDIGILYENSPFKIGHRPFTKEELGSFKLESEMYDFSLGDTMVNFRLFEDNGAHLNSTQKFELALGPECFELAAQKMVNNLQALWVKP